MPADLLKALNYTSVEEAALDIMFLSARSKYVWQDSAGQLISRWDNAPHWQGVTTFPHHRHVEQGSQVESSPVRTLEDVLKFIRESSQANRG